MADEEKEKTKKHQSITDMDIVRKAKQFALECHGEKLHPYHNTPHVDHLDATAAVAIKFLNNIKEVDKSNVVAACYVHDVMQYCGKTFTEISTQLNDEIAEMVLLVTPLRGKYRVDQQNTEYYQQLKTNECALFVKLCSRIANAEAAIKEKSNIFAVYYQQKKEFVDLTMHEQYKDLTHYYMELFADLDKI